MRKQFISQLTKNEIETLAHDWTFWARDKQRIPEQPFFIWLILAGRGFGKTRTGAETVRHWIKTNQYVNLIGATADDARDIMIEGESGILAVCPSNERPLYVPSKRRLEWQNGAISLIFTADEPERLRGKQHYKVWADELGAWRYPEAWDQTMMGLRLGTNPQGIVTTTPKPTKLLLELIQDKRNVVTTGTTYENRANLAKGFFDYVIKKYEGTRLGRQELNAELLTDVPGALWTRDVIDNSRVTSYPSLFRVGVGVDPHATTGETGIIVAGIGRIGNEIHGYVLEDATMGGKPEQWASAVVSSYHKFHADIIVGEINNGGDMIENTIRNVQDGKRVNYKTVRATRGKYTRAEPVSVLYGSLDPKNLKPATVHHVGFFTELEDQMCSYVPGEESPNNLDAAVWILTELMLGEVNDVTTEPNPFYN